MKKLNCHPMRWLSIVLSIVMILTMTPANTFATNISDLTIEEVIIDCETDCCSQMLVIEEVFDYQLDNQFDNQIEFEPMGFIDFAPFSVQNVADDGRWYWPVPNIRSIYSTFGTSLNVIPGGTRVGHQGIDISGRAGTPVVASRAGEIWHIQRLDRCAFGVHIILRHNINGTIFFSTYAHLQSGSIPASFVAVTNGIRADGQRNLQPITQNIHIGNVGSTGSSTGPHLHFEIRRGNNNNSGVLINTNASPVVVPSLIRPIGIHTNATISRPSNISVGRAGNRATFGELGLRYRVAGQPPAPAPTFGISLSQSGTHAFPARTLPNYALPPARSITVNNTGNQATGPLTITNSHPHLFTVSTGQLASIAAGANRTFTVQPRANLAAGTHAATITVSGGANIAPRSFSVSFVVNPAPTWGVVLSQVSTHTFPGRTLPNYTLPLTHTITVRNTGNQATGNLTVVNSNPNAFTVNATSLTSIPVGTTTRTFTVQPRTGLAEGTHTATITVSGGANITAQSFTVSFRVSQPLAVEKNRISVGAIYTLSIREDGSLWAWGDNRYGQLGDGTTTNRLNPVRIGYATYWINVTTVNARWDSGNGFHSLGIKEDGSLWAWGNNAHGQLGDGTTINRYMPTRVGDATNWISVSTSEGHSVGIQADGSLWAWGSNSSGQLGDGTTYNRYVPIRIGNAMDWVSISAGRIRTIGIRADGSLWGWGDFRYYSPVRIGTDADWAYVAACVHTYAYAIKQNGTLWRVRPGMNQGNQISDVTDWARVLPGFPTIGVKTDGSLWVFGEQNQPRQIMGLFNWLYVSSNGAVIKGIKEDGSLWSWGRNIEGQLGDGTTYSRISPIQIYPMPISLLLPKKQELSAGGSHSTFICEDGNLWSWGRNFEGQLGDGTANDNHIPKRICNASNWISISAGRNFSVGIREGGSLWAWGENSSGQLGVGDLSNRNIPTQISYATDWTSISAGVQHIVGIREDGSLWAWGSNAWGQLGRFGGQTLTRMGQVGIDTERINGNVLQNWENVSAGGYTTVGIQTDGSLWAWGLNHNGQLGDGTTTGRYVPTRIGDATDWAIVSTGGNHTVGIRADGSLWAWGRNIEGQLGDGTNTNRNTPTRIGDNTDWVNISVGNHHTVGIRADGSLWAWGSNGLGQLGDGTSENRNVPIRIGDSTNWINISAGNNHTMGTQADGSLWVWGNNMNGQVGDNTIIIRHAPVLIFGDKSPNISITTNNQNWGDAWVSNEFATYGETVELGAFAHPRYESGLVEFSHWEVISGGAVIANTNSAETTFVMPNSNVTIQAVFQVITTPVVVDVSANACILGGVEVSHWVASPGTKVTLSAIPYNGVIFCHWEVTSGNINIANINSSETYFITPATESSIMRMSAEALSIRAVFRVPTESHVVIAASNDLNWGVGTAYYVAATPGTIVPLTANTHDWYGDFEFARWELMFSGESNFDETIIDNTLSPDTFIIMPDGNVSIMAVFYPKAGTGTGGLIEVESNDQTWGFAWAWYYAAVDGTKVSLMAMPTHYEQLTEFVRWDVLGGGAVIDDPYSPETFFYMTTNNVSIRAVFQKIANPLSVEVSSNNDNLGTAISSHLVAPVGTTVTLSAAPFYGMEFLYWEVLQGDVNIADIYVYDTYFIMPNHDVSIRAVFQGTCLNELIEQAELRNQANYTAASWTPFAEALGAARKVQTSIYEGESVEPEVVFAATRALKEAMDALIPVAGSVLWGDVNGDGVVNFVDIMMLQLWYAGFPVDIDLTVADVNGDGVVNFMDIMHLQLWYAGFPVVLGPQP